MPKRWREKERTEFVRVEFETLFQYTGKMLLEEMTSIFLTTKGDLSIPDKMEKSFLSFQRYSTGPHRPKPNATLGPKCTGPRVPKQLLFKPKHFKKHVSTRLHVANRPCPQMMKAPQTCGPTRLPYDENNWGSFRNNMEASTSAPLLRGKTNKSTICKIHFRRTQSRIAANPIAKEIVPVCVLKTLIQRSEFDLAMPDRDFAMTLRLQEKNVDTQPAHSDSDTEGTHISETQDQPTMDVDAEVQQQTAPTSSVEIDPSKPLHAKVTYLPHPGNNKSSGGTKHWSCNHCKFKYVSSYTRIYVHFFGAPVGIKAVYNRVKEAKKNGVAATSLKNSVLLKNIGSKRKIEDAFKMLERDSNPSRTSLNSGDCCCPPTTSLLVPATAFGPSSPANINNRGCCGSSFHHRRLSSSRCFSFSFPAIKSSDDSSYDEQQSPPQNSDGSSARSNDEGCCWFPALSPVVSTASIVDQHSFFGLKSIDEYSVRPPPPTTMATMAGGAVCSPVKEPPCYSSKSRGSKMAAEGVVARTKEVGGTEVSSPEEAVKWSEKEGWVGRRQEQETTGGSRSPTTAVAVAICRGLTKVEGNTSGDAAITTSQLRRSDRVGHAGLRDLSGHDWTRGVGHAGLNDFSGHDSGCLRAYPPIPLLVAGIATSSGKVKADEVDMKIIRGLCANGIPFNVLRNPQFLEMIQAIQKAPDGYKPPSYEKARTSLLDQCVREVGKELDPVKDTWLTQGVSIVSDGWSNVKSEPLINFIAQNSRGATFMYAEAFSGIEKTRVVVAKFLRQAIKKIGPSSVLQVVTDNAANCKAAGREIEKCREALATTIVLNSWREWVNKVDDHTRLIANKVADTIKDEDFWDDIAHVLAVTKPIFYMVKFCDGEGPKIAEIYERMDNMMGPIKEAMTLRDNKFSIYYPEVEEIVVQRWDKMTIPLHCLGFALNPKYYDKRYLEKLAPGGMKRNPPNQDKKVIVGVLKAFARISESEEEEEKLLREQFASFHMKKGIYALAGTQTDAVTMDAIDWWATYGVETPDLADVAKRVLSQPISSSSAERNWSTYSHIHSVKRNRLNGPRADKLVFIHSNIRLLSRFSEAYKAGPNKKWDINPESDHIESLSARLEEMAWENLDA
ncbi:hypothetical protein LXL04_036846 [Taraxacum kok-saghyz]